MFSKAYVRPIFSVAKEIYIKPRDRLPPAYLESFKIDKL